MNSLNNYKEEKITNIYDQSSEWQLQRAKDIGGELIDDKIVVFPEELGVGSLFFTSVVPGISVVFMDFILNKPLELKRVKSRYESYIFHYDISEACNEIRIKNTRYKIGSEINLSLAILNNQLDSSFIPALNKRTLALRILVDKRLLNDFVMNHPNAQFEEEIILDKKSLYSVTSNSQLLVESAKNVSIFDSSFDLFLKGITLKLMGNFLEEYKKSDCSKNVLTKVENEAIIRTKKYLLGNLRNSFPSIDFLSDMAGMSSTKYKILFKKRFKSTPHNLFTKEKMRLANELLLSGDFESITEILYEINYSRLSYFSSRYFSLFHRKPIEDFVKKEK